MIEESPVAQFFERMVGRVSNAAGLLRVRSSLNPMLWLCGIVSPSAFFGAWLLSGDPELSRTLVYVGAAPILATCLGFFYFALFRPGNLQSEEYQIRHQALEIIRQKGRSIEVRPSSLEAIANPKLPLLPGSRGEA